MEKKGLVIAGLAGGSGKSVVSVGITAAFARMGRRIVPFKKGPDYIDAGWLQLAAGRRCYNLDPFFMSGEAIHRSFMVHSDGAELVIVEGNRGLYDGVDVLGGYSTAELALTLDLPVILVVNCTKTTRTVAAMVLGCQQFDKRLDIKGVVLNQIATERQRLLVTESVESYTGIPVLGSIPRLKRDIFPMRHLGMVPHQEYTDSHEALGFLADLIAENVDLGSIESIMKILPEADQTVAGKENELSAATSPKMRIGVLQDAAFQFYYSENLEALEMAGAQLVYVNALSDSSLPELDGLYIGGGFPETSARELAANTSFRQSVKKAAEDGLPIYAECGGLMYLGDSIVLDGEEFPLVGIFPVRFGMSAKPQAHGYTIFHVAKKNGFYKQGVDIKGHEFRYSKILDWRGSSDQLILKMVRGRGFIDGWDGLTYNNVLALYTHIHADGTPEWAGAFVQRCRAVQK
ncbi:hydrogenobyrinic acid a,c-diamide synthase (glutamine-hydrolyzing) [Desulfopila sp. IMCC35006]|uniref:cobyrinate a,c-diamide synthase n=1 Tax=Desulfopila sp. IMCC35006 TaxID=2569542 RepID=UPI0010AB744D|nr:cobyrinate a,c-diamide synthase [Desulfopila sp. IMCC35006]TKB28007.1 hydrogenobyrinic acid a,c-diamide synthase (glutamine-hydrolyzing) [Desulfopila sp. IMCC35006]